MTGYIAVACRIRAWWGSGPGNPAGIYVDGQQVKTVLKKKMWAPKSKRWDSASIQIKELALGIHKFLHITGTQHGNTGKWTCLHLPGWACIMDIIRVSQSTNLMFQLFISQYTTSPEDSAASGEFFHLSPQKCLYTHKETWQNKFTHQPFILSVSLYFLHSTEKTGASRIN